MRRLSPTEVLLLVAITLWALNLIASRFILTNGFQPLAYSSVRYGLGAAASAVIVIALERSLAIRLRDLPVVLLGGLVLYVNQIGFVYGLRSVTASVAALIFAGTPIVAALLGLGLRREQLTARFWVGSVVSAGGVALVALTASAGVSADVTGVLFTLLATATWAVYAVITAGLASRYSPARISVFMLAISWVPISLTGWSQTSSQDWGLGWEVWATFAFATAGPLVITNLIWFRALERIGPSRATLATNLQPFLAVLFGVALLGERLTAIQVAGGLLIAGGIVAARGRGAAPVAGRAPE